MNSLIVFKNTIERFDYKIQLTCSSGSNQGSYVLRAIAAEDTPAAGPSIRFSFSRYNTDEEVDYAVDKLVKHLVGKGVKA
ncbi:MAG: hypothetical protein ABR572_11710 [Cryomorphaceae bacterium]